MQSPTSFGEWAQAQTSAEAERAMVTALARSLAELSAGAADEAGRSLKRWRLIRAWLLLGQARAYLDASQRVLLIARNL